jgi:hypothetical protein
MVACFTSSITIVAIYLEGRHLLFNISSTKFIPSKPRSISRAFAALSWNSKLSLATSTVVAPVKSIFAIFPGVLPLASGAAAATGTTTHHNAAALIEGG